MGSQSREKESRRPSAVMESSGRTACNESLRSQQLPHGRRRGPVVASNLGEVLLVVAVTVHEDVDLGKNGPEMFVTQCGPARQ